jgi:uncharacterized protein (TIGR03067 family)
MAMRKHAWTVLAVGLLVAGVSLRAAADDKDDAAKKELKDLQGIWIAQSLEFNGDKVPADVVKNCKLVIKENKIYFTDQEGNESEGTFTIDATAKPKKMDVKFTGGALKDQSFPGIYELDKDTQKGCFASPGGDRPTEFATKAGSGNRLFVFKREKK